MITNSRSSVPSESGPDGPARHSSDGLVVSRRAWRAARRHRIAAGVAALALGAGVLGSAPTPAILAAGSSLTPTYSSAVAATQPPAAGRAAPLPGDLVRSSLLDVSSSGSLGTDVQKRSLRPILDWLKKHAPKQYQKVKAAAKKGKAAVKEWYNKLPKAVRVTIQFLWSGSVWSLIEALWKYFTS